VKSKILINITDKKYLEDYRKVGISAFLFALKDYCVGYEAFSIEEIKEIDCPNKYLLINRILDCNDVDKLRDILKNISGIKGIVYEDIGVYELSKELKLNIELIHFQNHFGTNINQVNFWLNRVDSIFICNELTIDEIKEISDKSSKPVCVHLYGHNQSMYSRRLLLTNWSEEFKIPYKNQNIIEETSTKIKFIAYENKYGTVMYSEKVFNGSELLNLTNIKYFYINPMFISHDEIMKFVENMPTKINENEDDGFLHKETIFKLKGW